MECLYSLVAGFGIGVAFYVSLMNFIYRRNERKRSELKQEFDRLHR